MSDLILFYDTETTGFCHTTKPLNDVAQPCIVQLACILCDNTGRELASLSTMVIPFKDVPQQVVDIHGITRLHAEAYGMTVANALAVFYGMIRKASVIVAHNIDYDNQVMRCEYARLKDTSFDPFPGKSFFCTMKATTDFCKLPKAKGNGYKWPKLHEVYLKMFNKPLEGAHDALVDIRATKEVYFEWRRLTLEAMGV